MKKFILRSSISVLRNFLIFIGNQYLWKSYFHCIPTRYKYPNNAFTVINFQRSVDMPLCQVVKSPLKWKTVGFWPFQFSFHIFDSFIKKNLKKYSHFPKRTFLNMLNNTFWRNNCTISTTNQMRVSNSKIISDSRLATSN